MNTYKYLFKGVFLESVHKHVVTWTKMVNFLCIPYTHPVWEKFWENTGVVEFVPWAQRNLASYQNI